MNRDHFFGFVVTTYLPSVDHLRPNSKQQIVWALENHLYPDMREMALVDIDYTFCQTLLNRKSQELKPWSVRHVRKTLCAILSLAEFEGLIKRSPCSRLKIAKPRKNRIEFYKPWEMWALYQAARGTIVEVPILLACFCGTRRGEALGLSRAHHKYGVLNIVRQLQKYADPSAIGKDKRYRLELEDYLKTGNSYRILPLPPELDVMLKSGSRFQAASVFLCPNSNGELLDPDGVDRALYAVMKKAKLRKLTYHQLRHSFSANLELMGCPTVIRLALMGQSTESSVATLYTHETKEGMALWLSKLWAARLDKPTEQEEAATEGATALHV